MSEPVLHVERDGAVATLTLSRPERANAWTDEMARGFDAAMLAADRDPDVRAVVVTGAGRAFCAGADLGALDAVDPLELDEALARREFDAFPPYLSTPVIAAVNGSAAGIGLAIAVQCDVRFVAAEATLTTAFTRRGLIAEHGLSSLLPALVGRGRAMDLLISARAITGVEAHAIGLAEFVLPAAHVLAAAQAYAHDLAAHCSPTAMAVVKAQLRYDPGADTTTVLARADRLMRASFTRPDVIEGVASWMERRDPHFPPHDPAALAELNRLVDPGAPPSPSRR